MKCAIGYKIQSNRRKHYGVLDLGCAAILVKLGGRTFRELLQFIASGGFCLGNADADLYGAFS
jgi:hypothetical protein